MAKLGGSSRAHGSCNQLDERHSRPPIAQVHICCSSSQPAQCAAVQQGRSQGKDETLGAQRTAAPEHARCPASQERSAQRAWCQRSGADGQRGACERDANRMRHWQSLVASALRKPSSSPALATDTMSVHQAMVAAGASPRRAALGMKPWSISSSLSCPAIAKPRRRPPHTCEAQTLLRALEGGGWAP